VVGGAGVILTKDNMARRKWQGLRIVIFVVTLRQMTICFFSAPLPKSYGVWWSYAFISHLGLYAQFWQWILRALQGGEDAYMLGLSAICWAIWKARNNICFDKKIIRRSCNLIFLACASMNYWSGLYSVDT
jgi:hypothetical protein